MMSRLEFDALVHAYLDGDATPAQVVALRDSLRDSPERRERLAALVRLHRAQSAVLGRSRPAPLASAVAGLRLFADRAGRCLAHACVLALVCVELDVVVPGVDMQSWVEPELASVAAAADALEVDNAVAEPESDESDVAPMPDVREADFLDS